MQISRIKKEENIIEYLLYMFQIEELVRASDLDGEKVFYNYIQQHIKDEKLALEYKKWYQSIADELKLYGKQKSGHINEVTEVQSELFYLHTTLLTVVNDEKYRELFDDALPIIEEFREKSFELKMGEIDLAIQMLYAKLLLRLKKQEITPESEEAFEIIRNLLSYLAKAYHQMKKGDLDFMNN